MSNDHETEQGLPDTGPGGELEDGQGPDRDSIIEELRDALTFHQEEHAEAIERVEQLEAALAERDREIRRLPEAAATAPRREEGEIVAAVLDESRGRLEEKERELDEKVGVRQFGGHRAAFYVLDRYLEDRISRRGVDGEFVRWLGVRFRGRAESEISTYVSEQRHALEELMVRYDVQSFAYRISRDQRVSRPPRSDVSRTNAWERLEKEMGELIKREPNDAARQKKGQALANSKEYREAYEAVRREEGDIETLKEMRLLLAHHRDLRSEISRRQRGPKSKG